MHPLTTGIHESKHAYMLKADILNTCHKLARVEKQKIASLVNIYHN